MRELPVKRFTVCVCLMASAGCGGAGWRANRPGGREDELPITRAVLYQNGIGYFERRGSIDGNRLTLRVRRDQIADFLKSLTVVDLSAGGRAVAVALPVDKSQDRQLMDLPPQVREQGGLLALASAFRGADAAVTSSEGEATGRIVGVEQLDGAPDGAGRQGAKEWRLTLLTGGDTLQSFRVADIRAIKILDGSLAVGLDKALDVELDQAAWKPIDLTVELAGDGPHDMVVSYVVAMPTWRPAYRVVLGSGGAALLQGWAVIDNVSGDDWRDARVSLTAGTPLAFTYDLYTPHYVRRPDLSPPEEEEAQGPPPVAAGGETGTMEDKVAEPAEAEDMGLLGGAAAPAAAPPPAAAAPSRPYGLRGPSIAANRMREVGESDLERNYRSLVTGSGVGSLFRYDLSEPITVRDRESALVSIVSTKVPGKEVLFFNPDAGAGASPYRAVMLENRTGLVLEHGPIAIYRDSTFLGEALSGRIEKDSTVFVPYAIDGRINVFTEQSEGTEGTRLVAIANGRLTIESKQLDRAVYDVNNGSGEPATLYVQRARRTGWTLTRVALAGEPDAASPPQPGKDGVVEQGSTYYVPIALPASGHVHIVVEEETPGRREVELISDQGLQAIMAYVSSPDADPALAAKLKEVEGVAGQLAQIGRHMSELETQRSALAEREAGVRQNLDLLGKSKTNEALRAELETKLASLDHDLDRVTAEYVALSEQRAQLKDQLDALVAKLTLAMVKGSSS